MKPSLIVLFLIGLLSCNEPKPVLPITPGLVTEIKAYDLDNNGNTSDIQMSFEVKDNKNVVEYRVMAVPTTQMLNFTLEKAASPLTNYHEVFPKSFENKYEIPKLPAGLLDVTGEVVENGREYAMAIFIVGESDQQLSEFSAPFTLKDQSIYAGRYWIGVETDTCLYVTDPNVVNENLSAYPADGRYFIDLLESESKYSGVVKCPTCPQSTGNRGGPLSFNLDGTTISNYNYEYPLKESCDVSKFVELGTGIMKSEIRIEINFANERGNVEGCDSYCTGIKVLIRNN